MAMTQLSLTRMGIEHKGYSPLLLLFSEKIKRASFSHVSAKLLIKGACACTGVCQHTLAITMENVESLLSLTSDGFPEAVVGNFVRAAFMAVELAV